MKVLDKVKLQVYYQHYNHSSFNTAPTNKNWNRDGDLYFNEINELEYQILMSIENIDEDKDFGDAYNDFLDDIQSPYLQENIIWLGLNEGWIESDIFPEFKIKKERDRKLNVLGI